MKLRRGYRKKKSFNEDKENENQRHFWCRKKALDAKKQNQIYL